MDRNGKCVWVMQEPVYVAQIYILYHALRQFLMNVEKNTVFSLRSFARSLPWLLSIPETREVYLRNRSAMAVSCAAILREKLQFPVLPY